MIEHFKQLIDEGERDKQRGAATLFAALVHADEFEGINYNEFCRAVGLKLTVETEIKKMIALKKFMAKHGYQLTKV